MVYVGNVGVLDLWDLSPSGDMRLLKERWGNQMIWTTIAELQAVQLLHTSAIASVRPARIDSIRIYCLSPDKMLGFACCAICDLLADTCELI